MRRLAPACALLVAATALGAQQSPIAEGAAVRVRFGRAAPPHLAGYRATGTLERLDADSLVLRVDGARVPLPRTTIAGLDLHRGRRSRLASIAIGTAGGMAGGALVGVGVGVATTSGEGDEDYRAFAAGVGAVLFGTVGGMIGLAVGATRSVDRWERVPLAPALRVGAGGAALSFAF